VLVDRLWQRDMRKESAVLMLWLKEIAPSLALRHWFGLAPACWPEFMRRYRAPLRRL
jgi:uncharacterized protein YeaO (DUF488 family)